MRQRKLAVLSVLSMTAVLVAVVIPAEAVVAAPSVTCGATVVTDVTLTEDLSCSGPGLIVGADGITIDLGGHTLSGAGPASTDTGISALEHSDLRIRRGTITGFRQAIELTEVEDIVLQRLRLIGNNPGAGSSHAALSMLGASNVDLLDSQVLQPDGTATDIWDARNMRVERLRASGRFYWTGSTQVTVTHSVFTDARIGLINGTSGVEIRHNVLRRSSVGVSQGSMTVADNRFVGAVRIAISISLGSAVVERNVISGAVHGVDIDVPPVLNARIAHNVFRNNDYGVVLTEPDLIGGNLLVTDNLFMGNRQAGIFLEATNALPDGGPLTITRNTLARNGHRSTDTDAAGRRINDGIHTNLPVGSPVTLSHNHTYLNADHGIEALPTGSVIDGGDNHSTGDPNHCAGLTCT